MQKNYQTMKYVFLLVVVIALAIVISSWLLVGETLTPQLARYVFPPGADPWVLPPSQNGVLGTILYDYSPPLVIQGVSNPLSTSELDPNIEPPGGGTQTGNPIPYLHPIPPGLYICDWIESKGSSAVSPVVTHSSGNFEYGAHGGPTTITCGNNKFSYSGPCPPPRQGAYTPTPQELVQQSMDFTLRVTDQQGYTDSNWHMTGFPRPNLQNICNSQTADFREGGMMLPNLQGGTVPYLQGHYFAGGLIGNNIEAFFDGSITINIPTPDLNTVVTFLSYKLDNVIPSNALVSLTYQGGTIGSQVNLRQLFSDWIDSLRTPATGVPLQNRGLVGTLQISSCGAGVIFSFTHQSGQQSTFAQYAQQVIIQQNTGVTQATVTIPFPGASADEYSNNLFKAPQPYVLQWHYSWAKCW